MAYQLDQTRAPLYEALQHYRAKRVVSFDVPGHKQGKGNQELTAFLGQSCLAVDVNSMKMLDNLIHPVSVIKEAQELAADAFGAAHCFFMVNGTTSAVQAMILATCAPGEKIILPRNVHRSALNALVTGALKPVYVDPAVDARLGIPLGMRREDIIKTISANPDAKAIVVNNPTYYGVCADLQFIVTYAHQHGLKVLVDEAHGTHFYFQEELPCSAMACGADMAAVSLHKTGGSLTQSSLLLVGSGMSYEVGYIHQIINLTQTTSASYLLMSSLDITRKNLALQGREIYKRVIGFADYARAEINAHSNFYAFGAERCDGNAFYAFDSCKLVVNTRETGLSGIEVYDILRDEYNIQVEFGDLGNFLAVLSTGDREVAIERLVAALSDIAKRYVRQKKDDIPIEYIEPQVAMTPREAFYAKYESLPLRACLGRISTESVMCYPPGIPVLAPGERVTEQVLSYIAYAKDKGSQMTGTVDPKVENLCVVK